MGSLAPAQAAIYTGSWDPAFGAAFPDLGWKGTASFYIPNACLAFSGFIANGHVCSGSTMQLLSATVDFYKVSDDTNPTFQETLTFGTPSSFVLGVNLASGALTGVTGAFPYMVPATLPLAGGPNTQFGLIFADTVARLGYLEFPTSPSRPSFGLNDPGQNDETAAFITFVPEPGTYAMFALGLVALGVAARRRQRV